MIEITEAVALKVRDTVAAGLSNGLGNPEPGQMCVEAAVCYALGLPADYAEWVVQILIEMQAPGCQWLSLVEQV